jgi:hypothetical protein
METHNVQTRDISNADTKATAPTETISKARLWIGWIITALPSLLLLSSGINIMRKADFVMQSLVRFGYSEQVAVGIGVVEFACTVLYLIPGTSVLGAILLTGYLGGATASHLRIGEPFIPPILTGVLVWIGLFLRDRRLETLIPWRR